MNRLWFDFVCGSRSCAFRSDPETRHDSSIKELLDGDIRLHFGGNVQLIVCPRIYLRAARDVIRYTPIYLVIDVMYFTALGRGGALV